MTDKVVTITKTAAENQQRALDTLNKLSDAAKPEAVFSQPVKIGDALVITASEVSVGLGFGFGMGSGPRYITNIPDDDGDVSQETGMGSGGGGGGGAGARPVAVITIQEDEVRVKPVLDATKIALAFLTMLGSAFFMGAQIRRGGKQ